MIVKKVFAGSEFQASNNRSCFGYGKTSIKAKANLRKNSFIDYDMAMKPELLWLKGRNKIFEIRANLGYFSKLEISLES